MKETRYFYVPDAGLSSELPADEATHAIRVLRLKEGDEIFLMDGCGHYFTAEVSVASSKHCMYRIKETVEKNKDWSGYIHLAIAPTKMSDRMEWMLEKATEVGFDEVTFLNCRFSERRTLRTDRLNRIIVSAMKQSRKPWKPVINPMMDFSEFVKRNDDGQKYIAHCYNEIARKDFFEEISRPQTSDRITVMIGPEGDFSIDEVRQAMENGYAPVSLGRSRLRTETAGLSAVMMSQIILSRR